MTFRVRAAVLALLAMSVALAVVAACRMPGRSADLPSSGDDDSLSGPVVKVKDGEENASVRVTPAGVTTAECPPAGPIGVWNEAPEAKMLAPFTGQPTGPVSVCGVEDWDLQVHSRDANTWYRLEAMDAQHGHDCGPPPASHPQGGSYANALYQCRDHVMTAINAAGYGMIYLTPNHLIDFSNGEAVLRFDLSTLQMSNRDWVDIWISPWDDNLALPLDGWLPDGQGEPRNGIHIRMDNLGGGVGFRVEVSRDGVVSKLRNATEAPYQSVLSPSATARSTFELRISKDHLKFGLPVQGLWWIDTPMPALSYSLGVVQLGHHAYNPTKAEGGVPATWHWDNVEIRPARKFTIVRAVQRYADTKSALVSFPAPAGSEAMLRFAAIGAVEVSFDSGATWSVPERQDGVSQIAGQDHEEHFSSYWSPAPAGATSVQFKFSKDDWYGGPFMAKDISFWMPPE